MKTQMKLILLIGFLCFGIYPSIQAQNVGDMAPDFTLGTLDGASFTLSGQKGKVVFIFFFGAGCPHCLSNGNNTETGVFDVYKSNPDFVAVGVDTWDYNKAGVESFKSSTGITYPLCLSGSSIGTKFKTTYDRVVVIDKEGVIRYKATANAISSVVDEASKVVKEYLAKSTGNGSGDGGGGGNDDGDDSVTAIRNGVASPSLFHVYPVPATNKLSIKIGQGNNPSYMLRLVGVQGNIVYEKQIGPTNQDEIVSISLEGVRGGLYMAQLVSPGKILTQKVVVKD